MSEIGLGQFIKNVFDYSTGKPVQQQPGKVANQNFQNAQNEAMKTVQKVAQNIVQNMTTQQDIMNTQMQLRAMSDVERSLLLKQLFDFPSNIKDLLQTLVSDGKQISAKELSLLMTQNIDLSKLIQLMQTNGKTALEKIAKMIATMNQSGIFDTKQLKEMSVLVNACIPANDASAMQVMKNLMIMYLPWIPINAPAEFNSSMEEDFDKKKTSSEDDITITITTKNYGVVKVLLFKDGETLNLDVNCVDSFPKDIFKSTVDSELSGTINKPDITFTTRKTEEEKNTEASVSFSKASKISPQLLILAHLVIKVVMDIDNKAVIRDKRKEML